MATQYGQFNSILVKGNLQVDGIAVFAGLVTITRAALGATNDRIMKLDTVQATPNMTDGYGIFERNLTVTGTATGIVAAESNWINLGASSVIPTLMTLTTDGYWDGGATLTNAHVVWGKYTVYLITNPDTCALWDLNFSGANSEIDAIFSTGTKELALGYQAGTPTKAAIGSIPFFIDPDGNIFYIYLHADADADD